MANKIYKKLPAVLQTTAIKNFFEATVEQLFSKSNVDDIQGYIGSRRSDDRDLTGKYLPEPSVTKRFYGLAPTVNTVNSINGQSENFFFYDELIDTLRVYGVDVSNHNKLFSEKYSVYLPPINVDKLINYAEYYWIPQGPTAIQVTGTQENPIDVDRDILGQSSFTPATGKTFRNGMIVRFAGDYVIPASKRDTDFVVQGVGNEIILVEKLANFSTLYSRDLDDDNNPTQNTLDYVVQEPGADNQNTWSRVNFWYHRDNFLDAGDDVPSRSFRADRPILEFDRDLELYNHGASSAGAVDLVSINISKSELENIGANAIIDDVSVIDKTVIFISENSDLSQYVYNIAQDAGNLVITRVPDPENNPQGAADGDVEFVPLSIEKNQTVHISQGQDNRGREFIWDGAEWKTPQEKLSVNQAPLFMLYDTNGIPLDDPDVYPDSNFSGNKLFGLATHAPLGAEFIRSNQIDPEFNQKLVYKTFKASSEILFENFQFSETYEYIPVGESESTDIVGYHYYKLNKLTPEFHSPWKIIDDETSQRIVSTYELNQLQIDQNIKAFYLGCVPDVDNKTGKKDIRVLVNGKPRTDFVYGDPREGFIEFTSGDFQVGDFIEISAFSTQGLLSITSISKYELPVGWTQNPLNQEILQISEPEYLTHFKRFMESQPGFLGDPLAANNFSNTPQDPRYATDIVQTNQDIMLGAFLLDDQPHNLLDALRFNAQEYIKYKNRLRSEIAKYYQTEYNPNLTHEEILEIVLRNLIAYKVGDTVFNQTYIVPFGDTHTQEDFVVALDQTTFVLDTQVNLNEIENSLLIYHNNTLMCVDCDYEITSYNPITVQINDSVNLQTGDTITAKIYDENRDSAQCPPTPSTMGLYSLYLPEKIQDNSYQTPVEVIVGHDGTRTPTLGDVRDDILLEFEKRVYNAAKREFRDANSLPEYNINNVLPGAFRDTGYGVNEINDLLRHDFSIWASTNNLDYVTNEFYDANDPWTWNYNPGELPGHWKGLYVYYYDTYRPHTHPWEMLGFTEKPTWWDSEYYLYEVADVLGNQLPYTDYSPANTKLWNDLEQGIIRQGPRANLENNLYLLDNPYRRSGLVNVIPVDSSGNLRPPRELFHTDVTQIVTTWNTTQTANVDPDYDFRVTSYLDTQGLNISYDTGNVYVENQAQQSYTIPRRDLANVSMSPSMMPTSGAIGVLINGEPLYGQRTGTTWNDSGSWYYDAVRDGADDQVRVIDSTVLGQESWDTSNHSPVVGWAFDGMPIYGPHGYAEYDANGNVANANITNVRSSYVVRSGTRADGPGGAYTGVFVEDYEHDANLASQAGYADQYNMRYGVTPESNGEPIHFYVATQDDDGQAMFPYHVGGSNSGTTWNGYYYQESLAINQVSNIVIIDQGGLYTQANTTVTITGDGSGATAEPVIVDGEIASVTITNPGKDYTHAQAEVVGDGVRGKLLVQLGEFDNNNNNGYVNAQATFYQISVSEIEYNTVGQTGQDWTFGDGAPVEQAWKSTEGYPFAVAEALLLAKPGRFATVFADPTKLYRPAVDPRRLLSTETNTRWKFYDENDFRVHGDLDDNGRFISNIGYTQFIHSWLTFQGLQTTMDFANKMRTLNMKMAHRMSGYVDKDTMVARTDQYSSTGTADSLIIPQENINVVVHSSPYKTRNFYSGVIIEKTDAGYKVRGYDRSQPYFEILESDTTGPREEVEVGGEPADHVQWEPNKTYSKDVIVEHLGRYYRAPLKITTGTTFDRNLWTPLPRLPQVNAARGVVYQRSTGRVLRVNYETTFTTVQQTYDFLVSLGRYQDALGYDFGEYDQNIGDIRNWAYAAKQFLFWITGAWEIGNTLQLSPLATSVRFEAEQGFVAKINRNDREQFCVVDQDGAVIDPKNCEIVREDNAITVRPISNTQQIYGLMLFVKEIEHVVAFDNNTVFGDTLYDPVLNQQHSRIRIKGKRTADWQGRFLSEGFIINGEELLPNPDNLAESLGRYHEFGFIPVERQLYESARALFGFTEEEYLRELDVLDEQQFEFYRGLIQNKGTTGSLSRVAQGSSVALGNVTVYDEWALRLGEFGDTENFQSIELKLNSEDIQQDPQLVTLDFPEDVTNIVERIDVLDARYTYTSVPEIEIAPPNIGGEQATAVAELNAQDKIERITVTNPGSGYPDEVGARVVVANVLLTENDVYLGAAVATRENDYFTLSNANVVFTITDNISNTTVTYDVHNSGNIVLPTQIENAVNNTANVNVNVQARVLATHNILGNANAVGYSLILSGSDFDVVDGANVQLVDGNYQPQQRFKLFTTREQLSINDSANVNNLSVMVDNVVITDYVYNSGQIIQSMDLVTDMGTTRLDDLSDDISYPRTEVVTANGNVIYNIANTSPVFTFANTNLDSNNISGADAVDQQGQYRFVDVYVNGVLVENTANTINWYDTDGNANTSGNSWSNISGVVYTLTQNSIQFTDVTKLPSSSLVEKFNPPLSIETDEPREVYYAIDNTTDIQIIERATVEFTDSYQGDLPGSKVNVRVTSDERIAARVRARRNYEITSDVDDDVLLIDIDDSDRFLKKPTGVRENNLWPTTQNVDHTGITDPAYPKIRNSGYVNPANVNFQAFDIPSIPDLFSSDLVFKPGPDDLIHVARAERDDWNVYQLTEIDGQYSFLYRNNQGKVSMYTDYSLFNYLDTNQIGASNTGRFLDYYVALRNSNTSDNVVVWRNEDVVNVQQLALSEVEAPRMIEARIASIGPADTMPITNIEPTNGDTLSGLRLIPSTEYRSDDVLVVGDVNGVKDGDAIQLIDNVGTSHTYDAIVTSPSANTFVLDTTHIGPVTITDGGSGYKTKPNITIDASPAGAEYTATAEAFIEGCIDNFIINSTSDFTEAQLFLDGLLYVPEQSNAEFDVYIQGGVFVADITDGGLGYDSTSPPTVTITGGDGTGANAEIVSSDIDTDTGKILRVRITDPGTGYRSDNLPNVTIGAPSPGSPTPNRQAYAQITEIQGNVKIDVLACPGGRTQAPTVEIVGDGTSATAEAVLNANVVYAVVTNAGLGYSSVPNITIETSPDGANATATANTTVDSGVDEVLDLYNTFGSGNVAIVFNGDVNANLLSKAQANIDSLTADEINTFNTVNEITNRSYYVDAVINNATGQVNIVDSRFTSDIASNIDNASYTVVTYEDYSPANAAYYTVSDVTTDSFVIDRPNTVATNRVQAVHLNRSRITAPGHGVNTGDIVRIDTNVFGGEFVARETTANTFVIDSAFNTGFSSGDIIRNGIRIKTVGPHGISPAYARFGKRIAVHFANPLYYNKVYTINEVTPDSLVISSRWPRSSETFTYYEEKSAHLNASNPYDEGNVDAANATNTISITDNYRLSEAVAFYNSNADVVSGDAVTILPGYAVIDPRALPGNTTISTKITIMRQVSRQSNRYPVLTTLDHNKAKFNGTTLSVDSYNNIDGMNTSINRAMDLRRQFTRRDSGFGLRFGMLNNQNTVVQSDASGRPVPAYSVGNYGPYIREEDVIKSLVGSDLPVIGRMKISDAQEKQLDPEFNPGPDLRGPVYGLVYVDPDTGTEYRWNPVIQNYRPVKSVTVNVGDTTYVNPQESDPESHTEGDTEQEANALILQSVPGTGSSTVFVPGVKQTSYNMLSTRTYNDGSGNVTLPAYRLAPSTTLVFEIYQAVQNDALDIYYILADKSNPPTVPHNFYGTVNQHSDFGGYPRTDYYYDNDITPSLNGSNQITNANDPIRLDNQGTVIELPPVEPAAYVGKQVIPEPYAVQGGNGTNAEVNLEALPELTVESSSPGSTATVTVNQPGYNSFLLWTPGMEPGQWRPSEKGPGQLPGVNDNPTVVGYGRGYYTQDDAHLGSEVYPVAKNYGYNESIPRFLYAKKFSVYPGVSNKASEVYLDANGNVVELTGDELDEAVINGDANLTIVSPEYVESSNESTSNQGLRPEEIFVACFWTEPYTYKNQLVGFDYNNLTAGVPTPEYADYPGTIVRVKYIRLTELPRNAYTRRLIPDTGWGGKPWKNILTDNVNLSGPGETDIWSAFEVTPVSSGSTGDDQENTSSEIQIGNPTPGQGPTVTATGEYVTDTNWVDEIPVTPIGPVLNAGVLEGLPGPCTPVPQLDPPGSRSGSCLSTNTRRIQNVLRRSNFEKLRGTDTGYYYTTRIAGDEAFRIIFDSRPIVSGMGIAIFRNKEPYTPGPEFDENSWWESAVFVVDTQSNGSESFTNGSQVGQYGVDEISPSIGTRDPGLFESPLGIQESDINNASFVLGADSDSDPINVDGSNWIDGGVARDYGAGTELAVQGMGFLQRRLNCTLGEYVTIFVKEGTVGDNAPSWKILLDYHEEVFESVDDGTCSADEVNSPSAEYIQGAKMREWTGGGNINGYFGQDEKQGERPGYRDNIYFPYSQLPATNYPILNDSKTAVTLESRIVPKIRSKWAEDPSVRLDTQRTGIKQLSQYSFARDMRTAEWKGYFQAPVTGEYQIYGGANDGLWVWISSSFDRFEDGIQYRVGQDDLSGKEYFKQDGYPSDGLPTTLNAYMDSKNYHRDNSMLRTGFRTSSTEIGTSGEYRTEYGNTRVRLEKGKYYFVRIVAGNSSRETGGDNNPGDFKVNWRAAIGGSLPVTTTSGVNYFGNLDIDLGDFGEPTAKITTGAFFFSGRLCTVTDDPPAGNDETPEEDTGGGDGSGSGPSPEYKRFVSCLSSKGISPLQGGVSPPQGYIDCHCDAYGYAPPGYDCDSSSDGDTPAFNAANDSDTDQASDLDSNTNDFSTILGQQNPDALAESIEQDPESFGLTGSTQSPTTTTTSTNTITYTIPGTSGGFAVLNSAGKTYLNFSGYSQQLMTGYNFYPVSFKQKRRKILDPAKYGYSSELGDGRFVSTTEQRISGGLVVPLARKLTTASRTPKKLSTQDAVLEPWSNNLQGINSLNETIRYNPRKIGSTANINGREINNTLNRAGAAGNGITINGPAFQQPATQEPTTPGTVDNSQESGLEPIQFTSFDNRNIRYATQPVIDITPLNQDAGETTSAGPTARARITRPTPTAIINQNDLYGIPDDSELLLNGRRVVVRGRTVSDIKTQINCADLGLQATTQNTQSGEKLVISSCTGRGWSVANGCAGGRYKQVGDFHINRGFEQAKNTTETITQQYVFGPVSGTFNSSTTGGTNGTINQSSGSTTLPRYEKIEDGEVIAPERGEDREVRIPELPAILPVYTNANQSSFTTGGSGYRVGDRLRLIGGTPINNVKGPLTQICIDTAGAGYTNPANLQVVINTDGNAPGIGAAAAVTQLDSNGGIAGIEILNQGAGYDLDRPPRIEIVDTSPAVIDPITISTAWPDQITINPGQIVRVEYLREAQDNTGTQVVDVRHVRATAPVEFGTESNATVANTSVAFVEPNTATGSTKPRVEIQLDTSTAAGGWIRPNSYVEIEYQPVGETTTSTSLFWIPEPSDGDPTVFDNKFYIEDSAFTSQDVVANVFGGGATITVTTRRPWWKSYVNEPGSRSSLVDTVDPRLTKIPAQVSAKIAINPDADLTSPVDPQDITGDRFAAGYSSFAGPIRVAKFIVTDVDNDGSITGLKVIDRGLYKVFPSDLTFGIPLEYDYVTEGSNLVDSSDSGVNFVTDSQRSHTLGVGDPARDNVQYGTSRHPEYQVPPFSSLTQEQLDKFVRNYAAQRNENDPDSDRLKQLLDAVVRKVQENGVESLTEGELELYNSLLEEIDRIINEELGDSSFRHPDWKFIPEFYWNGQEFVPYNGSPGAFDPSTYALIDTAQGAGVDADVPESVRTAYDAGLLLKKAYKMETNPNSDLFGRYIEPFETPGGTGARLFVTAQEVPDCSEKGTAKEALGLPDQVVDVNAPESLAADLNNGLIDAGYDPEKINFEVTPFDGISVIDLVTDFPGVNIDSPTPGFLEKLGIPLGDYTLGILCMEGALGDGTLSQSEAREVIEQLYENDAIGVVDEQQISEFTGQPVDSIPPTRLLNLLCLFSLDTDNNSIFGDSVVNAIREMYRYDITNIYGDPVDLNSTGKKQNIKPMIFQSKRFNESNSLGEGVFDETGALFPGDISDLDNAWIDNYRGQGWAYLENGVVKRQQEPLVDTNFVHNALVYDAETGKRTQELNFWDPFKGVLPGFIRTEIDFITDEDPVSYNNARTNFGRNNVGKVWWDTSTVCYHWYEQGPNTERWKNWGRAFPGSSITVCEWVESRALPQNWTGNGIPRWRDRYVTERYFDSVSGKYEMYYYYWVQNRSVVDDRIRRDLGRQLDTQTLARYIANPVGYEISMIGFASDESFVLHNITQHLDSQENHLQINLSRNLNADGLKHTAWKLAREGDDTDVVPDHLTAKMIDSLSGYNAISQEVPDTRLSSVERYGIAYRPRQTMFRDIKEARRVMASIVNQILASLKLDTQYPGWKRNLPAESTYFEIVDWYAVDRIDPVTQEIIRYDDTYKPVRTVSSVNEIYSLGELPDETVIQVQSNRNDSRELWMYNAQNRDFDQISIANETLKFTDRVFTDSTNPVMGAEIRAVLESLVRYVFPDTGFWNTVFFEMLKYAYLEQGQLSWAFKTSYLYVEKQEDDLREFSGFRADNFEKILDYMAEVKPYNAKIREYKDGKSTPLDRIGQNQISDYDKPPYTDINAGITRPLDENLASDRAIMNTDSRYIDYFTAYITGNTDVIRKTNTTLVFDRTNWLFTQFNRDATVTNVNQSIAENIANITQIDGRAIASEKFKTVAANADIGSTVIQLQDTQGVYVGHQVDYVINNTDVITGKVTDVDVANVEIMLSTATPNVIVSNTQIRFHTDDIRAIDRIFKFDPKVQQTFALEVNRYFDDATAFENSNIVGNASAMANIINAGGLATTLALLQTKIGGDYRGELLNSGIFNQFIQNQDYQADGANEFGYDITAYDTEPKDQTQAYPESYAGSFLGNSELFVNSTQYDGFDATTFSRSLYGPEAPEELISLSPLENLIITVTTSPDSRDDNGNITASILQGREVTFRIHQTLFGDTDYLRLSSDESEYTVLVTDTLDVNLDSNVTTGPETVNVASTQGIVMFMEVLDPDGNIVGGVTGVDDYSDTVTIDFTESVSANTTLTLRAQIYNHTEVIRVADSGMLEDAAPDNPGYIWIDDEKIAYGIKNGNELSQIQRGVHGTTIENHSGGSRVYSSSRQELFNDLDPEQNVWLDVGTVYTGKDRWMNNDVWDEYANTNVTIVTANATVTESDTVNRSANLSLDANIGLVVNDGIRISDPLDASVNAYVAVTAVESNANANIETISVVASAGGVDTTTGIEIFDTDLFSLLVPNSNIVVETFDYGAQDPDDFWDAANTVSQTAISLADAANVDFTRTNSIMRFLHGGL